MSLFKFLSSNTKPILAVSSFFVLTGYSLHLISSLHKDNDEFVCFRPESVYYIKLTVFLYY